MNRLFAGMAAALLAAVLLFSSCTVHAIGAQKAVLVDGSTGRVLYEKNADSRGLIASTTKIMTALIVCEQCNVLDRMRIPKEATGIEGSSMYLQVDEVLTIQELLYGLMLQSGNDAAVALAIYCGGTVEGFVQLMNDKAHSLGLNNTHFANPNGLDHPDNYSTAKDLAALASYAMGNPIFAKTVGTKTIRIGERTITNHNKLLWRVDGADGIKTGYTKAAGRILVSSAMRNSRRLVAVTMNDPDDWKDHAQLLEEGFSRFRLQRIINSGDCVGIREIAGGETGYVELISVDSFSYPLAQGEETMLVMPRPEFVYAPVVEGDNAGTVYVCIGETAVGKVSVVYGRTVERKQPAKKNILQKIFGD